MLNQKNKVIIIHLAGGIGNQMFQYAVGRTISLRNNIKLLLDLSFFKKIPPATSKREFSLMNFNISGKIAEKSDIFRIGLPNVMNNNIFGKAIKKIVQMTVYFKPICFRKFIKEPYFKFCPYILKITHNCYLDGYWQSEKYFKDITEMLKKEFTLKNKPSLNTEKWIRKIKKCSSVSIHIRRGDYVSNFKINKVFGICSQIYYEEAINLVSQKIKKPTFFIEILRSKISGG
ncbi:alpha-1,2-fucosyltransferase [Candidatus Woesearchaeota archaeon]|nr:alpha-1,2-fucosyltransferase [Candidatus Woesearchaeota archaeon]